MQIDIGAAQAGVAAFINAGLAGVLLMAILWYGGRALLAHLEAQRNSDAETLAFFKGRLEEMGRQQEKSQDRLAQLIEQNSASNAALAGAISHLATELRGLGDEVKDLAGEVDALGGRVAELADRK